jgi:Spy/CpxP family protein refolding chaperone
MKKNLSISLMIFLTFILIGVASAETPSAMDDDSPEYSSGHCQGMRHKGPGILGDPENMNGIGGITLKKLMRMDLSDDQKKEAANILAAHRDDSRKMADQLMEAQKAFSDTISSDKASDESTVRQAFRQMSALMENLVVQKTKIMVELKPILSQDQLKDLMTHHQQKSDKMGNNKKMDAHRDMMDTWINTYADIKK